jgi:hypothetical protein
MTRKLVFAIVTVVLLAASAGTTFAQADANSSGGKQVGLGFIVGEPTGIDFKFFLNKTNALQFALAWSLNDEKDLHIQGDYIWHRYDVIDLDNGDQMPLYFGIGGRVVLIDDPGDDVVGIRFPVGLDYIFADYPFDVFVEIVPILDLAPDTDFDLEGAIGARFWF